MLGRLANFVPINTRYVSFAVLQQALHRELTPSEALS